MTININIGNPQGPAGAAGVAVAIAANTIVANNTNATANPTGITASAARELLEVPSDTELAALLSPLASVAYVGANFAAISHNHSADNITSGALAKARQHAQTAYYDAAGTWAETQTIQGDVTVQSGNLKLSTTNAINTFSNGRVSIGTPNDLGVQLFVNGTTEINAALTVNGNVVSSGLLSIAADGYINGSTYFRSSAGVTKATIDGNTGAATFNGNVQLESATPTQTWQVSTGATAPTYTEAARQFQIKTWQLNSGDFATTTDLVANSIQYNNHAVRLWVHTHGTANPVLSTTFNADGSTTFNGPITSTKTGKLGDYTVATLPSASANTGYECNVTDSSVTTFGSTVAGGGSNNVKVRSNGTNWTVTGI